MSDTPLPEALGPASVESETVVADRGGDGKLSRGAVSWAAFEGGRDPYVILLTIYVFMPYVSAVMVGDPVKGQALIARFQQYAGWIVMATGPLLGAVIDKWGPRKPFLAGIVALMVPLTALLWFLYPGSWLPLGTAMAASLAVNILFVWSEVLHNSMLVRAAGMRSAHAASGLALSLGNAASVFALGFTAWAFALPGKVDCWWVPAAPLFGLDPALHEPERVVTLMAAGLIMLGAIPLFLFTPDAPRTGIGFGAALRGGFGELKRMVATVRQSRDAVTYLLTRMFFYDGMNGVLFFFGVLAAGVMKWGPLDLLFAGIILSVVAVVGGQVGRWLDAKVGPKNALKIEIAMTMLGLVTMLGMEPDRILYLWSWDPEKLLWSGPVFKTVPSLIFLLIGFNNAIFITAQYASARTTLTRLTEPSQAGAFFGVFALSGFATAWLAPMLVSWVTELTHSQRAGFASIVLLLGVGLVGLFLVRGGNAHDGVGSGSETA